VANGEVMGHDQRVGRRATSAKVERYVDALAQLLVGLGANVQPGQIVSIAMEPGQESLSRAIAAHAYAAGAKFVDVFTFDPHVKRARALNADPESLSYVPPWIGEQVLHLKEMRAATIGLTGPVEPRLMADVDPELLGRDMLPMVKEIGDMIESRQVNWTVGPCPSLGWAQLVYPDLDDEDAFGRLWDEIAHICRLTDDDPVEAWKSRFAKLSTIAGRLGALSLDALRYEGPGTDLTIGLLPSSRWQAGTMTTVDGIEHAANLPSEEIFTTPDPERVDGFVTASRPLFVSGALITGLTMRFNGGHATAIDAENSAETLRELTHRDSGATRIGEVALVDGESRVGKLGTIFCETLLDENAASHIALGNAYAVAVSDVDQARINTSEIHIDVMIGDPKLDITGLTADGTAIPILRNGAWQPF
jgi:aminopeptidase